MAEYVVVDKEQLEADITTVADAIREKGGTSEQLPFPNGMADAVRGIESGGNDAVNYLNAFSSVFSDSVFPSGYEIDMYLTQIKSIEEVTDVISFKSMFSKTSGLRKVKIKTLDNGRIANLYALFQQSVDLEIVDFSEFHYKVNTATNLFYNCTKLETVYGELDFADLKSMSNLFFGCKALKEIRFANETLVNTCSFANSPLLSDASTQSIINGLASVETSQTITWHKEVYDKLTDEQKSQIVAKNWTLASA